MIMHNISCRIDEIICYFVNELFIFFIIVFSRRLLIEAYWHDDLFDAFKH